MIAGCLRRKALQTVATIALLTAAAGPLSGQGLDLSSLPLETLGGVPETLASEGVSTRARELQSLARGMLEFFRETLEVEASVALAVLDPSDWSALERPIPYGLPWGTGTTVILPSESSGPVVELLRSLAGPEAAAAQILVLTAHEVGHVVGAEILVSTRQPRWFGEFFASYLAYLFLAAERPELARSSRLVSRAFLESMPAPESASLEHFEAGYRELLGNPPVYGWYQNQFNRLVAEIAERSGLQLAKALRDPEAFDETTADGLWVDELERIVPGFERWAESLRAGARASTPP